MCMPAGSGQLPPNVKHLGRVSDNDLAFLYQNALCLVFPSWTEGFGLPALEAMSLGCPVISSDAASLPEVCGEAALYAPPNDGSAWLAAIGQIAAEPTLREKLGGGGAEKSKSFFVATVCRDVPRTYACPRAWQMRGRAF